MFAVVIGITSALVFGAADFLGGLGSRRISALRVTAVAGAAGLVALLLALPFVEGVWSTDAVALGALSGVCGAVAISLLYACLAIGPMSILSPLTAVVSAIVPLSVGLTQGERLGGAGYVGIGLALVAVVLVGFVREKNAVRPSIRGILMAIGSGSMIGLFLVIIDLTPADSGLVPLVASRTVNSVLLFAAVGVVAVVALRSSRGAPGSMPAILPDGSPRASAANSGAVAGVPLVRNVGGWRPGLKFAAAAGVIDAAANTGVLLGLRLGDLSVVSVLTALYPSGTIILAAIVLKERIAVVQYIGLALAVTATALFAAA